MIKEEIIREVAENAKLSDYEARMAVEATLDAIRTALISGDSVILRGWGTFKVKQRAPKSVRDINNGQQFTIASRRRVVFQPGKSLNIL